MGPAPPAISMDRRRHRLLLGTRPGVGASGVDTPRQSGESAERGSLLAVEVRIGLVPDEEHVDDQRYRYARGHVRDEQRHLVACLERLIDQRRRSPEYRV